MTYYTKDSKGRFKEGCICVCGHIHWKIKETKANPMHISPFPILVENWCPDCNCENFKSINIKEKMKK